MTRPPFVERHGLWTDAQARAADDALRRIADEGLETVRFAFVDQHGLVRGKSLSAPAAVAALRGGVGFVCTNLLKDSSDRTAWPIFARGGGFAEGDDFEGAGDVLLVADPATFRVLPWAPGTGWVQCDAHFPDGRVVPFDTRRILRRALERLAAAGHGYRVGLEVECHVFRAEYGPIAPEDAGWPGEPPRVSLLNTGYRLLAEQRFDALEPAIAPLRAELRALGLPLRSVEVELGPSQVEFVFEPLDGLAAADAMALFRNAAKQSMRRRGYHVSFMCRPRIPHVMSSGWHLHQSLLGPDGGNAFVAAPTAAAAHAPGDAGAWLSPVGRHFLAGLLEHARGACLFATPTINGYRRFRPNSLAPDRAAWACDNRGAMLRVVGGPGDPATRIENRAGEPAANPYLFLAAQVHSGLDGLARALEPGPSADLPYETPAPRLPTTLAQAVAALRDDARLVEAFGRDVIDWYARIKDAEVARFEAEVSEWEQREYFDLF